MDIRSILNILEGAKKAHDPVAKEAISKLKAPADGEKGKTVTVNGYKVAKLPKTADFAYEAEKNGKGEKFYSLDAVLNYVG